MFFFSFLLQLNLLGENLNMFLNQNKKAKVHNIIHYILELNEIKGCHFLFLFLYFLPFLFCVWENLANEKGENMTSCPVKEKAQKGGGGKRAKKCVQSSFELSYHGSSFFLYVCFLVCILLFVSFTVCILLYFTYFILPCLSFCLFFSISRASFKLWF